MNTINIKPDCLSKLKGEDCHKLLDSILSVYFDGKTAVEELSKIDYHENKDSIVDYSDLFNMEDFLIEKYVDIVGLGSTDRKEVVKYATNALSYFNEACETLDIDSCSNTVMDCAVMISKLKFAVANASTFLYNILSDLVSYVQYLCNIEDPEIEKQTRLQYPEYDDVEINYNPEILEILRRFGEPEEPKTLSEFVHTLLMDIREYRTQNTAVLSYYSEYSEFYDFIENYNQVEIQDAVSIIMPQDIKYILGSIHKDGSLAETILDQLYEKLNGRMGIIEGVQSMSYEGLDSLVWLAKYCKSEKDFEDLYVNERLVCSNPEIYYLCIARESIDSLFNEYSCNMNTTSLF